MGDDKQSLPHIGAIIFSILNMENLRDRPKQLDKDHITNKCGTGIHA